MRRISAPELPADRDRMLAVILGVVTIGVAFLCLQLMTPFVAPLTWAVTFAVIFDPVHRRLLRWLKSPPATAALSALAIAVVLGSTAVYVGGLLAQQAMTSVQALQDAIADRRWESVIASHRWLEPAVGWVGQQLQAGGYEDRAIAGLMDGARRIASGSIATIVDALLMMFFLFYFLRDRVRFLHAIPQFLPLSRDESRKLISDIRDAIRAVVYGTVAVAAIQGALGGLMFWWLGLPAPLLWGVIMTIMSMLPMVGAALVWGPVALFLALTGDLASAAILAAWGAIVIGLVDNVVKPVLVKDMMHVHTVAVFISVLGGLYAFGASGVVLGPIVLAIALGLLGIWRQRIAGAQTSD